jgi:type IV secretion system protein VirD4
MKDLLLSLNATTSSPIGFRLASKSKGRKKKLLYSGDKHLVTFASTGSGKGTSAIIPNLLNYEGPIVVIDPKAENYFVTRRKRKEMGHRVVLLDPFGITGQPCDSLNIFESIFLSKEDNVTDCQMIANNFASAGGFKTSDPFWDDSACNLITGIIAYLVSKREVSEPSLKDAIEILLGEELEYFLATILDNEKCVPDFVRESFISFLNIPSDKTRPCVLSTASSYFHTFRSEKVLNSVGKSTFPIADFLQGKPLDIFIVIPPDKFESHKRLLVLWISTLIKAIVSRKKKPVIPTLFMLDETATLGNFYQLENFLTLCRGYGAKAWLFFQDLQQLQKNYPNGFQTILNNSGVMQIFGIDTYAAARDLSFQTGISANTILNLPANKQLLIIDGVVHIADKINYLRGDDYCVGFDANPFY